VLCNVFISWHRFYTRHSASPWEPFMSSATEADAHREIDAMAEPDPDAAELAEAEARDDAREDNVVLPEGIEPDGREGL